MMSDKVLYLQQADDAAFMYCFMLAMNSAEDKRGTWPDIDKGLWDFTLNRFNRPPDLRVKYCVNKYGYLDLSLQELQDEYKARGGYKKFELYHTFPVCGSCHFGSSTTPLEEVQAQRDKYDGYYICSNCEKAANEIADGEFGEFTVKGKRAFITEDGVYYDEGMRANGGSMLGFGGRWYMLITREVICIDKKARTLNHKGDWVPYRHTKTKVRLTNNLFIARSLNKRLLPVFKHNVDTVIRGVELDWLRQLHKILDGHEMFKAEATLQEGTE